MRYLAACPAGYYKYLVLKGAHKELGQQYPSMVQGGNLETWAAQVSDRVLVLLNHSRRLVPEGRWRQAISCLTPHQVESLKIVREHFLAVCPVGDSCSSGSSGDFLVSGAGGRSLKATRSDDSAVSVDSMGLPT
jgi:hypothetical protein